MEVVGNGNEVEPCVLGVTRVIDERSRCMFLAGKRVTKTDHARLYPLGRGYCAYVRIYEGRLVAGSSALQRVRHEVAEILDEEGVPPERIDDTLLVLSELGTNAIHAGGYGEEVAVRLDMDRQGDVFVEVEDAGVGFRLSEQLRLPDPNDEHGRGLSIVCLVADETSVKRRRRHTIVTARIPAMRTA